MAKKENASAEKSSVEKAPSEVRVLKPGRYRMFNGMRLFFGKNSIAKGKMAESLWKNARESVVAHDSKG